VTKPVLDRKGLGRFQKWAAKYWVDFESGPNRDQTMYANSLFLHGVLVSPLIKAAGQLNRLSVARPLELRHHLALPTQDSYPLLLSGVYNVYILPLDRLLIELIPLFLNTLFSYLALIMPVLIIKQNY